MKEQQFFMKRVCAVTHMFDHVPLAYTHSYGCQQNVNDSQRIEGMLLQMGFTLTDEKGLADVIIFNTCAIRENAHAKVYGKLGALKHLKAKKPSLIIGVCGCMAAEEHVKELLKNDFHISFLGGVKIKTQ